MSKRKTKTAKVPLGPALHTEDAALDIAALITPADIEEAQVAGRNRCTPRGAALLAALPPAGSAPEPAADPEAE